jgi:hypothetical protein
MDRATIMLVAIAACASPAPRSAPAPVESVAVSATPDAAPPAPSASASASADAAPPTPARASTPDPAHCGIGPGEATIAPAPWPGESAHCKDLDLHWAAVAFDERACTKDSECAVVIGNCDADAVTKKALSKYREPRCEQPLPRTCSRPTHHPACVSGCCRAVR